MEYGVSFVCASSTTPTHAELPRSYGLRKAGHPNCDCFLWEAVRATLAAPLSFESVTLESPNVPFIDEAVQVNNPIDQVSSEADRLWPD
jgi:predicted acylesterase/phospholipase RssA